MRYHAKIGIVSAALSCACAQGALEEPQRRPTPSTSATTEDPSWGVTPPGSSSGSTGAQSGAGGASGGLGGYAGVAGRNAADSSLGGSSNDAAAGSSDSAGSPRDCPSLTRARLANGQCVDRIAEFSVGTAPTGIATGSDGRIWFDDGTGNQLVQLDYDGRVLDRIPCPPGSTERELIAGRGDALIWYTDFVAKTLFHLNQAKDVEAFFLDLPPQDVALGPDGFVWVTELNHALYRVDIPNSSMTRWDAAPSSTLTLGPDENLWFPNSAGKIARVTPAGTLTDFSITNSFADDIVAGPDGALWFVDGSLSQVGRVEIDGTLSRTFDLPTNSQPFRIIAGPDGALWFTEMGAGKIGRITVGGAITHYPIPTAPAQPYAITVGTDRNLWFTERSSGKVARLIPDPVP